MYHQFPELAEMVYSCRPHWQARMLSPVVSSRPPSYTEWSKGQMSQAFGATGIFPLDRNRVKPSTGIIDTSLEEEGGLAYIPLLRPALERNQKLPLMPSFTLEEMEAFHSRYQKEMEDCSTESDKRYRLWMKMYHPHLEASGDGPSSFQDSLIHTPVKKGQQRVTVAVLARQHSTIQHMLRCPSPPTSLPSLMLKTSCCVLTNAENLKNIDDKQKKWDEEARLKEERWKIREQKKKENQKKRAAKCSTPKYVPRKCNCIFSIISLPYCPKQTSMGACSSSTKTRSNCMD